MNTTYPTYPCKPQIEKAVEQWMFGDIQRDKVELVLKIAGYTSPIADMEQITDEQKIAYAITFESGDVLIVRTRYDALK